MHSIEIRLVVGPENILFAGVCVHFFSPVILQAWGREGVNVCATGAFHYHDDKQKAVVVLCLSSW